MVEIGASTTAGDVIEMIEAEGSFKDFAGSGGWMVFEVAQDFGMGTFFFSFHRDGKVCFNLFLLFFFSPSSFFLERPIRSFELVTDVQASWNKDKMVNYLVVRMTPLEVPLNRSVCIYLCVYAIFLIIVDAFFLLDRLSHLAHLLIPDMLNGRPSVESGVNDSCNYENIVYGYPNVIT